MKVGDLVKLRELLTNRSAVQDWGYGFIEEVYESEGNVEVSWPNKDWTSRTIANAYLEVISESR